MKRKVFVSGCYDMLHSGHVAFFEEAAQHGDLYVGIGSDKTVYELKGRKTVNTELERLYMIKSIRYVKDAWVNSGSGIMDFLEELKQLQPDIFFVNSDGHSAIKEDLCKEWGIQYIVSERIPHQGLPERSTTDLRKACRIPYRIDLAGGWLDQPEVSRLYPGAVLTICIEPDYEFNDRSGMATSSRKKAIELWHTDIPVGDKQQLAKTLFCYENPPGAKYISGSQDSLGIIMPGLNRFLYQGEYWPTDVEDVLNEDILEWLEKCLWLVPLYPRNEGFDVLSDTNINEADAKKLSIAAENCWKAILSKNIEEFGKAVKESFEAQIAMYPNMISPKMLSILDEYKSTVYGWKVSGAGGGGYFIFVNDKSVKNAMQIRIRRNS